MFTWLVPHSGNNQGITRFDSFRIKSDEELIHEIEKEFLEDDGAEEELSDAANKISIIQYYLKFSSVVRTLVHGDIFNSFIFLLVIVAGVGVGIETYPQFKDDPDLDIADNVISCIFIAEVALKIIAEGIKPWQYFTDKENGILNRIDFAVTFIAAPGINSMLFGANSSIAIGSRIFRLIRLVKLLNRIPAFLVVMRGMIGGLKSISYIAILMLVILYLYALVGVSLFRENNPFFFRNVVVAMISLFHGMTMENWSDQVRIDAYGCEVFPAGIYATKAQWPDNSTWNLVPDYYKCDNPNPQPAAAAIFWVSYITIASLILLSLFVGTITMSIEESLLIMQNEKSEKTRKKILLKSSKRLKKMTKNTKTIRKSTSSLLSLSLIFIWNKLLKCSKKLSVDQKLAAIHMQVVQELIKKTWQANGGSSEVEDKSINRDIRINWVSLQMRKIVEHNIFSYALVGLILLSSIIVGLEIDDQYPELELAFIYLDNIIAALFVFEIVLRIAAEEFNIITYFSNYWNFIDFSIVLTSWLPFTGSFVIAIRLIRMLRIAKLFKALQGFQVVITALFVGLKSIGYIGVIITLFYYMFAIIGSSVFSENDALHFGTLDEAMLALFQVATLDNWGDLMYIQYYGCDGYPLRIVSPLPNGSTVVVPSAASNGGNIIGSADAFTGVASREASCINSTGFGFPAFFFFLCFIMVGSFIMLSLFTGVVTSSMSTELEKTLKAEENDRRVKEIVQEHYISQSDIDAYRKAFYLIDLDLNGVVDIDELRTSMGFVMQNMSEEEIVDLFYSLDGNHDGYIEEYEFCMFLVKLKMRYMPEGGVITTGIDDGNELHSAVLLQNLQGVQSLVAKYEHLLDEGDGRGKTPLHLAVIHSFLQIAEWLIEIGADVNARDIEGKTCLHYCKHRIFVELLCKNNANVNSVDTLGENPLITFIFMDLYECADAVLHLGADPGLAQYKTNKTSFHLAAEKSSVQILEMICKAQRNMSYFVKSASAAVDVDNVDFNGFTALHCAAAAETTTVMASISAGGQTKNEGEQQLRCLQLLVAIGANPLAVTQLTGETALHIACNNTSLSSNNQLEGIVQYLLEQDLGPNTPDCHHYTPLLIACANYEWNCVKLLLSAGGDLNLTCDKTTKQFMLGRPNELIRSSQSQSHFYEDYKCSANDLIPSNMREVLYAHISWPQSSVPLENIRHCSECGIYLTDAGKPAVTNKYSFFGGKTQSNRDKYSTIDVFPQTQIHVKTSCIHCGRVVCLQCCTNSGGHTLTTSVSFASLVKRKGHLKDFKLPSNSTNNGDYCSPCFHALSMTETDITMATL